FVLVVTTLVEADANGGVELPIGEQLAVIRGLGGRDAELLHGLLVETSGVLQAMVRLELLQRLYRLVTEFSVGTETRQLGPGLLQGFLHSFHRLPRRVRGELRLP